MVKYYRTTKGLYYKILTDGTKKRISKDVYLSKVTSEKQISKHRSRSHSNSNNRKKNHSSYSRNKSKSRNITKSAAKKSCQQKLSTKIRNNIKEYNLGKYSSRKQAIAVSYSEFNKSYPECNKFYRK